MASVQDVENAVGKNDGFRKLAYRFSQVFHHRNFLFKAWGGEGEWS